MAKGDDIHLRLIKFAVQIIKLCDKVPATRAGNHVAGQLLRCGTAPAAHYAEARGAESDRDFTHKLRYAELEADARAVLKDQAPIEREVESEEGRWFLTRLRPYRTVDDRIDGVVLTFVDVTERKATEHRLRTLTAELDHRVKNVLARVLALGQLSQAGAGNDSPIAVLAGPQLTPPYSVPSS